MMSTVYSVGMMPEWEMTVLMKSWCFCENRTWFSDGWTLRLFAVGWRIWPWVAWSGHLCHLSEMLSHWMPPSEQTYQLYTLKETKVLGPSQTEWEPWRVLMLNIFGLIMVDCSLLWLQCSFRYNHGILCLLLLILMSGLLLEVFIRSHWGRCSCGNLTPSWWEWGWFLGGWIWGN